MNTAFLTRAAFAVAASLIAFSAQPAEARSYRYDDHRSPSYGKKHDWRWSHRKAHRAPRVSTEVRVQQELARRGYYRGTIDGQIGMGTRSAIRAYQIDRRLPVTGRIDDRLLRSLRLA